MRRVSSFVVKLQYVALFLLNVISSGQSLKFVKFAWKCLMSLTYFVVLHKRQLSAKGAVVDVRLQGRALLNEGILQSKKLFPVILPKLDYHS